MTEVAKRAALVTVVVVGVVAEDVSLVDTERSHVEEAVGKLRATNARHGSSVDAVETTYRARRRIDTLLTRSPWPGGAPPASDAGICFDTDSRRIRDGCGSVGGGYLARETRDEAADAARLAHVRDLEVASDQRPVPEQPSEERLLQLDRAYARQPDRRRTPA